MEPPPYQPIAGSSCSTGLSPAYESGSVAYPADKKAHSADLADGEMLRWDSLSSSSLPTDHPLHGTFSSDLNVKKDGIRTGLVEGDIYISPGQSEVVIPLGSGRLNGYIQIVATSPRKIQSVRVRLVRRQALAFPSGIEEDDIVEKELLFPGDGSDGLLLQKGVSIFEFRFTIHADSAVHEDSPAAKSRHVVVASALGSASGWFGSDLQAETPFWVFAAPMSGELESQRLSIQSQGMTDALGPFSFEINASAFIVASALRIKVTFQSPPPTLTLYGLKVYLVQEARLSSHRIPGKYHTVKRPRQFALSLGPAGPYDATFVKTHGREPLFRAGDAGEEGWTCERIVRLPSDRDIRPTTHPSTVTNVRMSSTLHIDLVYTSSDPSLPNSPESRKVWVATIFAESVSLGSCACFDDRLALPDYKPASNDSGFGQYTSIRKARSKRSCELEDICLCNTPWEEILNNEIRFNSRASSRMTSDDRSGESTPIGEGGKAGGRKHAETFPGDLDVVEGTEWDHSGNEESI